MRTALKGSLATLDRETGHPYASLVLVATEPDGAPVFLISKLALHTRNLLNDPRASVLVDGTGGLGDPLSGGRVTLMGEARPTSSATAMRRFLARHPSAEGYAGFTDFAVYQLTPSRGHYIGGFGRIVDLEPDSLLIDVSDAGGLIEAEAGIVEHMNSDHADAVTLYATELAGCTPGAWRMSGIDPGGLDLLHCTIAARVDFPAPVRSPGEARRLLVGLAGAAREAQAKKQPPA
jgi:putative heme iron utilization protein